MPQLEEVDATTRPRAGYRTDIITTLLGTWTSLGFFIDGWAHINVVGVETFFTPWHAVFYSGFAAGAAWICWLVWLNHRRGARGVAAIPIGYGAAVIALAVFAACGVGDYLWHLFIGVERSIDILFSPTHLGLAASLFVIVSTPLRAAWSDPSLVEPSLKRFLPAALGLAFATALLLLVTQYANASSYPSGDIVRAFSFVKGDVESNAPSRLAGAIVVTNLLMVAPLLLAARRFRLPFGTATVLAVVTMLLATAIADFENLSTALGFVLAGLVIDVLSVKLRPGEDRLAHYRAFAAAASFVTWAVYFLVAAVDHGALPTVTEMWTGAPLLAALHSLLVSVLLVPTARR